MLLFHRSPGDRARSEGGHVARRRTSGSCRAPRGGGWPFNPCRRWMAVSRFSPMMAPGRIAFLRARTRSPSTTCCACADRLTEALVEEFRAATDCEGEPMSILKADAQFGEGFNHWLNVTVRATRSAQVRHWWAARGIIVSRLMRVRFGPVHLSRELPRGHSRAMTARASATALSQRDRGRGVAGRARGGLIRLQPCWLIRRRLWRVRSRSGVRPGIAAIRRPRYACHAHGFDRRRAAARSGHSSLS